MKKLIFLLTFSICSLPLMAQLLNEDDPSCREKCVHGHISSRDQQVDYYQYPSMGKYDVKYLKLDLKAEAGTRVMSGIATTVVFSVQALDSFNIELKNNMVVDSVYINGIKRIFSRGSDFIFVPLAPVIPAGNLVTTVIYYNGTAGSAGVYAGTVGSNGLTYTATLSESYQAREWFPVKQVLGDKIDSADIWVTTSAINKVGSNGLLIAVVDSPNSKKQYQWKTRYPMNYYMPSISIGNYLAYTNYAKPLEMAPDSIPILHYIVDNTSYFNSVVANLDKTPAFIEKFSELFGLYPFKNEKYGHAHASIGGGMEHQTMTTTSSFGSTIIAHELGHQWWGDQVTCASWNHIWLNEGFASYCEYLAIENYPALFSPTTAAGYMQSVHTNVMSSPTGSVYVPEASVFDENRIFSSRLSYNKGSAIIHNLRFEMQDDNLFFQTLKNYQSLYKNSVATADDFKTVAENTCGRSFSDFFNQWYYGEGYPTFNITFLKQGSDSLVLVVNESVSAPGVTPFFKGLLELKVVSEQGDTIVKVNLASNDQVFKFRFTKTPDNIIIDPNNWMLNANGTITNGGTIPVKLLSYSVTGNYDCSARLNWKAANEDNSKQYEVEYSTDGRAFIQVAVIASKHQENSSYDYQYPLPGSGFYYFRLKLVDQDGRYGYSRVISIDKNCSGIITAEIIPNPVINHFMVKTRQPGADNTSIRIFDAKGSVVYKEVRMVSSGENSIPLNIVSPFASGHYLLRLENKFGVISRKFIKL